MARREKGAFAAIAAMPWPAGIVLGLVAYVGIRYGLSWYMAQSGNMFLSAVGRSASAGAIPLLAWTFLGICWAAALASFIGSARRSHLLETRTGLGSLRTLDWRQFETLAGEAFRRQGYRVEQTELGGADGGVDLILRRNGKTTLVQCKQWRNQRVDVKVVREMYGLLTHHAADAVKIVAVGNYTRDAERFARGKPIELVTGGALLALIRNAQTARAPVAAVPLPTPPAPEGPPSCPTCGTRMLSRTNHRTHQPFWGCPNYPKCRGTRPA